MSDMRDGEPTDGLETEVAAQSEFNGSDERSLEEGLEETFPASDPLASNRFD